MRADERGVSTVIPLCLYIMSLLRSDWLSGVRKDCLEIVLNLDRWIGFEIDGCEGLNGECGMDRYVMEGGSNGVEVCFCLHLLLE